MDKNKILKIHLIIIVAVIAAFGACYYVASRPIYDNTTANINGNIISYEKTDEGILLVVDPITKNPDYRVYVMIEKDTFVTGNVNSSNIDNLEIEPDAKVKISCENKYRPFEGIYYAYNVYFND